jgi:hypothetical protein
VLTWLPEQMHTCNAVSRSWMLDKPIYENDE